VLLSMYDRAVCLCVDRRYRQEHDRVEAMLLSRGVSFVHWFVDGRGSLLHPSVYSQITPQPPDRWQHGVGAYAHFRALQTIVAQAKRDRVDNLLFVEDDCVFTDDFEHAVSAATIQIMERGLRWDLLYYGANHTWAATEEVSPNVLRCFGSYTTHCMGIPSHFFDAILSLPPVHVIDWVIANRLHPHHLCLAVWPSVAVQRPGFSFLSYQPCDYTELFKHRGRDVTQRTL
jgi:hypothetical protein